MKSAPTSLVAFLNSGAKTAVRFDLYTITLQSGAVLRWTDADIDIPDSGNTFTRGPVITRSKVKESRGVTVGNMTVTLASPSFSINGQALPIFAAAGGFEGAWVRLDIAHFDTSMAYQGALPNHFYGKVATATPSRMGVVLDVKAGTHLLSQQIPAQVYQAACPLNLYSTECGVNRASKTVTGTVSAVGAGSNPSLTVSFSSSIAASNFELGALAMTSGLCAGISRTVQKQTGSGTSVTLSFARPFPFTIAPGDTVSASAGCDKTVTTCANKFSNTLRFGGTPFIPVVETAT